MNEIPYAIIRSDRKSIALVIDSGANLIVRAPYHTKDRDIANLVNKKRKWISEKQHHVKTFGEKHSTVKIKTGESLLFLGNTYTILSDDVPGVQISNTNILIPNGWSLPEVLEWLKNEAQIILTERVELYSSKMGVTHTGLKLSEAKARWGSCSAKNSLNFAWRLVMCPLAVIDYVVVHELSHITYKNHNAGFWARVKTVLPDFKEQQAWLKINRKLMEII